MFVVHCCGDLICLLSVVTDSLKFTSALSVALAVVFLVITVGIAIIKLISGGVKMPRLIPDVTDLTSLLNLFTVVPVLVTAYICHYNGMEAVYSFMGIFFFFSYILVFLLELYEIEVNTPLPTQKKKKKKG